MKQKMESDILRVYDLCIDCKAIDISILELTFNEEKIVKAWNKIPSSISALPGVNLYNLFRLVVHIIDRRSGNSSLQEVKGTKHGAEAKVHNINLIVIILGIKAELGLANGLMIHIQDEIVID